MNTYPEDYLVIIETQKVKSYLFASPYMRETRGGSVLLDLLNRKETRKILEELKTKIGGGCEEIYLGGGSGRIRFDRKEDAQQFADQIIDLYRSETVSARISVEVVARENDNGQPESFQKWVSRGVGQTQQDKLGRLEGVPLLEGRWIRPCSSCGCEPAVKRLSEHGEHWLCRACIIKRMEVNNLYWVTKRGKKTYHDLKSSDKLSARYTENFIFTTLARYSEKKGFSVVLPQDFEDIGKVSRPLNYMGFIYADGNRMGETIKSMGDVYPKEQEMKQAYTAFSEIVDQATRDAAVDAVMGTVKRKPVDDTRFCVPAEYIMAGGDDLMLVVPAQDALDVAVAFIERYQDNTRELQAKFIKEGKLSKEFSSEGLTTSAGVIIAHVNYPVSDLMIMAGDLMKLAKKKAADLARKTNEKPVYTGTLDFMVVHESVSEPVKKRREKEYMDPHNAGSGKVQVARTERPYTVGEAKAFLQIIRNLKAEGFPRTKLKALYPVLFQKTMQAQFDAQRLRERIKTTGQMADAGQWQQLTLELDLFPFRRKDKSNWTTPLSEIIELYDFIQLRPSSTTDVNGGGHD